MNIEAKQPTTAKEIFVAACRLSSPVERAQFLQEVCHSDADLRRRIEEMLAAEDDSRTSPLDRMGAMLNPTDLEVDSAPCERPVVDIASHHLIGPYKLLEQIGEGGMGLTFGFKPCDDLPGVHSQLDDLESHLAADRFELLRVEDRAHPTFADLFQQFVGTDQRVAGDVDFQRFAKHSGFHGLGRAKRAGDRIQWALAEFALSLEQQFDFLPQGGIVRTDILQVILLLLQVIQADRCVEDFSDRKLFGLNAVHRSSHTGKSEAWQECRV